MSKFINGRIKFLIVALLFHLLSLRGGIRSECFHHHHDITCLVCNLDLSNSSLK